MLLNTVKRLLALLFVGPLPKTRGQGSSVSDNNRYTRVAERAAERRLPFHFFRSHPAYTYVLDHVPPDLGTRYLVALEDQQSDLDEWIRCLDGFSSVGSPATYNFKKRGRVAPTIFRYLKVASDLNHFFGPLEKLRISEIGVGWGGQAWALHNTSGARSFVMYDLEPVNLLVRKMLSKVKNMSAELEFVDGLSDFPPKASDLVISNYAFSELNRANQERYLNRVLLQSPRGYITWNDMSEDGYTVTELQNSIPGLHIVDEAPSSAEGNKILVWGQRVEPSWVL